LFAEPLHFSTSVYLLFFLPIFSGQVDKKKKQKKSIPLFSGRIKRLPTFVTGEIFRISLKSRNSPPEFNNLQILPAQSAAADDFLTADPENF